MSQNQKYIGKYRPLHFASCEAEATLKWTPDRHRKPKGFGWHMSAVYMGGSVRLKWHKAPPVGERDVNTVINLFDNTKDNFSNTLWVNLYEKRILRTFLSQFDATLESNIRELSRLKSLS